MRSARWSSRTYTTCQRDEQASWQPARGCCALSVFTWIWKKTWVVAENATLEFQGVGLASHWRISFPLSEKRKSGLLPPTIIPVDSSSGPTVAVPYYWNIVPNRDATFTPMLMARRGVNLGQVPLFGARLCG